MYFPSTTRKFSTPFRKIFLFKIAKKQKKNQKTFLHFTIAKSPRDNALSKNCINVRGMKEIAFNILHVRNEHNCGNYSFWRRHVFPPKILQSAQNERKIFHEARERVHTVKKKQKLTIVSSFIINNSVSSMNWLYLLSLYGKKCSNFLCTHSQMIIWAWFLRLKFARRPNSLPTTFRGIFKCTLENRGNILSR